MSMPTPRPASQKITAGMAAAPREACGLHGEDLIRLYARGDRRMIEALVLVKLAGCGLRRAALAVGVHRQTVQRWVSGFNASLTRIDHAREHAA